MTGEVKAIETRYSGCRFRSRLEARWAVFFDALGVKWEYEPQGFDLASGLYLPDFWLPFPNNEAWDSGWRGVRGHWVEIKPVTPDLLECSLLLELTIMTQHNAYCFAGEPWPDNLEISKACNNGEFIYMDRRVESWMLTDSLGAVWYELHCLLTNVLGSAPSSELLLKAFRLARSARFEHGECGE